MLALPARERSAVAEVSRSGVIPEPTVIVRMEEKIVGRRGRVCALRLLAIGALWVLVRTRDTQRA